MKRLVCILVAAFAAAQVGACWGADAIRVAVQKTGTFSWELAVMRAHGLDKQANLSIKVQELASPEAGKIALRSGDADIIISDWLWVSRERALGAKLTFYPYSSALGGVMVPDSSSIKTLAGLRGHRLAVAGGPLDKNWLLMRASLQRDGLDVKSEATIVYGAPPLVAAAVLNGGADATLNYWNFCAALEDKGFRRIATTQDVVTKLGAKGPVAMLGYVFDKQWGDAHRDALTRFIEVSRKAKEILASSDNEWQSISRLTGAPDASTLRLYRDRYREGIPRRPVEDEESDARILYRVLAKIGGPDLVGPGAELDPGTFYHLLPGD